MSLATKFKQHVNIGGHFKTDEKHQQALFQEAEQLGLTVMVANCDRARSRSAVLRAIAKAVDYPQFFGNDMDALYDCLCETVMDQPEGLYLWLDALHTGDDVIGQATADIVQSLDDVADYATNKGRKFIYTIIHAGKHADPEPGVAPEPYLRRDD
ncbi:MAG TPA: barstar family protein [Paenalcaligenes sp.]|nr:barstar family protein [Paenalcaligenes sp.]